MGVTMNEQLAAGSGTSGILLAIVGVLVVAVLLAAVWGRRIKARGPGPPLPEQQPRLPESGPVGDVVESREPDELVPGEQRLTPHEVKGNGTASHRRR
ncbi:DUF6479 family protein [Streptomyces libani]|uniref:DUF6479 family protein n=1 Tax=Streptomyces nigrescens TaxID=1920 RepID=UPI00306A942F